MIARRSRMDKMRRNGKRKDRKGREREKESRLDDEIEQKQNGEEKR